MTISKSSDLLSRRQAAAYLGLQEQTLAIWASNKRYNLPFCKIGSLAKYKLGDLDRFIQESVNNGSNQ